MEPKGKPDLTDVYEALRAAEADGRADDVQKLIAYIDSVENAPPAEETYDPRDLISPVIPASAGAASGAVVPKLIQAGVDQVKAGRATAAAKPPVSSVTVEGAPSSALADIEEATTKGLSNEVTQQTRTAQRAARTEQMEKILAELKAKGVPVNPKIIAEMEAQYARPGSGILIPVERAREIAAQEAATAKAAPKPPVGQRIASQWHNPTISSDIGNFAKGIYDFKLPFIGSVGPLLGRSLIGAGAGIQGTDAYNRAVKGDIPGAVISGIGATGTAANLLPHPAAKAIGTGVGLSAEAINAYRDAMREGRIEHGAPEDYGNINPAGDTYAQGGLVHLAGGGRPEFQNPEDKNGMFSYTPGYYAEVADRIAPEGRSAGPNDAARHMLASADLTRRIGGLPIIGKHIAGPVVKGLGYGHEIENYIRGKFGDRVQTNEDMEQDLHNNALGIELGKNAGSFQDIVNKIPNALDVRPYRKESDKAYIRNPQEVGTPYKPFGAFAQGGSIPHYQTGRLVKAAQEFILPAAENAARTQIIGTLPTYKKAADIFAQRGATGQALDFGAGLGKGAQLLGTDTHTYEPFAKGWNPTYSNAKDIPSDAYGRLTNLNVLNVVPRDVRDQMVLDIGRTMEPGGSGIITTRGADVMNAKGRPGPEPTSIITSRDTYQKGFSKQELEDYLKYMLGQGYDINKLNLGPAGAFIQKKAEGGLAHLAQGGQPPKSDANEGGAFIGYPQINKNRKIGSGTGFLDALVGAPPSHQNILNPSDYSYMEGYEKGEPYGIAGMVAPFVGGAVKPLAKEIGKRAFMGESLTPRMLRGLMPEQPVAGIFRNEKGGNWSPADLTSGWTPEMQLDELRPMPRELMSPDKAKQIGYTPEQIRAFEGNHALDNWIKTQLTRYVKNEMGTPDDPIRKLADQGILHYKPRSSVLHNGQKSNIYWDAETAREQAGIPEGDSALTQLGKDWENNVDAGVTTRTVTPKFIEWHQDDFPWLKNAEGKKLHSIQDEFLYSHLGFDHIADVLKEQLASGALRPESMKNLSVPQAVQRTHEYNLAKEKAMQKAKLQQQTELPVHKEYPEGYKWLELKHPTNNEMTEQALKYEGDAMGHCVGGYCPDVLEGKSKIYSLRDAKGEPHVTVEVQNRVDPLLNETSWSSSGEFNWKPNKPISDEMRAEINAELQKKFGNDRQASRWDFLEAELRKRLGEPQPKLSIEQIKGKQNLAPKAEYQPFVQDFVRSGDWADVRDVHNTGLKDMAKTGSNYELTNVPEDIAKLKHTDRYNAVQKAIAEKAIPQYATEEEVADAIRKYAPGLDSLK